MPDEEAVKKVLDAKTFLKDIGLGQEKSVVQAKEEQSQPVTKDPWGMPVDNMMTDAMFGPNAGDYFNTGGPENFVEKPVKKNPLEELSNLPQAPAAPQPSNYVEPTPTGIPEASPLDSYMQKAADQENLEKQKAEYEKTAGVKGFFAHMIPDWEHFWPNAKANIENMASELYPRIMAGGPHLNDEGKLMTKDEALKEAQNDTFVQHLKDWEIENRDKASKLYGENGIATWAPMIGTIALAAAASPFTAGTSLSMIPGVIGTAGTAFYVGDVVGGSYHDQDEYAKQHGIKQDPKVRDAVALGSGVVMGVAGELMGGASKLAAKAFSKTVGTLLQESANPTIDILRKYIENNPDAAANVIKNFTLRVGKESVKGAGTLGGMTAANDLLADIYKNPEDREKFKDIIKNVWTQAKTGFMFGGLTGSFTEAQSAIYTHLRRTNEGLNIVQTKDGKLYERVGDDPYKAGHVLVLDKNLNSQSIPRADIIDGVSLTMDEKKQYLDAYDHNKAALPEIESSIRRNAVRRQATKIADQVAFEEGPAPKGKGIGPASKLGRFVTTAQDKAGNKYFVKRINPDGSIELNTLTPRGDGTYEVNRFTVKNLNQLQVKDVPIKDYVDMAVDYYNNLHPATDESQPETAPEQPGGTPVPPGPTVPEPPKPEDIEAHVEEHFKPLADQMEMFRHREDRDLQMYEDQKGQLWYKIDSVDNDVSLFANAESGSVDGHRAEESILANSVMKHVKTTPFEEWSQGVKDNIRMGLQLSHQQKAQEDMAAQQAATAPGTSQATLNSTADNLQSQPVPRTFPITFEDKKIAPATAVEQPDGTYLIDRPFATFKEADKVKKAVETMYGHKGFTATVESQSTDATNPFAPDVHQVRISTGAEKNKQPNTEDNVQRQSGDTESGSPGADTGVQADQVPLPATNEPEGGSGTGEAVSGVRPADTGTEAGSSSGGPGDVVPQDLTPLFGQPGDIELHTQEQGLQPAGRSANAVDTTTGGEPHTEGTEPHSEGRSDTGSNVQQREGDIPETVGEKFVGKSLEELGSIDMEELDKMDFSDEDTTIAKKSCIKKPKGGIALHEN